MAAHPHFSDAFYRVLEKRHGMTDNCEWQPGMVGPACRPKSDVRKAAMLHQDSYWFAVKHEKAATWLLLAILGLSILPGLLKRLRVSRPRYGNLIASTRGYRTIAATMRGFGYWQPVGLFGAPMPSSGATIVISIVFVVTFVYSMVIKPWYRPTSVWGSTPLGIRTGLISNAMVPFVYILALKVNPITWLTGLSHERLQVYHQWLARIALFLGIIHSAAFIYQPIKDGGYHNLVAWWKFSRQTWDSGAVALALMAWLVASSTRVFRNMSYEFFVAQHILSAIAFLGGYFWHTTDLIESWKWLWPIVAVWGFSAFARIARAASSSNFFMGTKTSIEIQSDSVVNNAASAEGDTTVLVPGKNAAASPTISISNGDVVRITMRTSVRWEPGQHVFVRFPTLAPTQSHPFTVVNLPNPDPSYESILVLLARVRNGVTRKLLQRAQWHVQNGCCEACPSVASATPSADGDTEKARVGCAGAQRNPPAACCLPDLRLKTSAINIPAIIDGPYGENATMASYDNVFVIAGGLGGTIALPILMDLAVRARKGTGTTKSIRLLISFRNDALQGWFEEYLIVIRALLEHAGVDLRVDIHCTSERTIANEDDAKQRHRDDEAVPSCCGGGGSAGSSADDHKSVAASGIDEKVGGADGDADADAIKRRRTQGSSTPESLSSSTAYLPSLPSPHPARADLRAEIRHQARVAMDKQHKTMAVVVCGPQSMMADTANAAASLQWDILKRKTGSLRELFLLKEGFSW